MKIIPRKKDDNAPSPYLPLRSMFDDFFSTPMLASDFFNRSVNFPSADIWEEANLVKVKMAIPGVNKEDVNIEVNENRITIKGESKKEEKEDTKKKYFYKSLETSFEQSFNLPSKVNGDKAEASYKDGVLTVTLPKNDKSSTRKIKLS